MRTVVLGASVDIRTWLLKCTRYGDQLGLVLLISVFAVTYADTLLPGVHEFGDVTKAQFIGRLLGTTHPTGYPLYILLTGLFSWLPFGTLAIKANAFSVVCAICTLGLVYRLQLDLGVRAWVALVATAALGFSRTFWSQAVIAEVYTLNSALLALTLWCWVRFRILDEKRWFLAACVVYALSFGNHLTVVTLLPAIVVATFSGRRAVLKDMRIMTGVGLAIGLGVLLYLYPIWRTRVGSLYLEYGIHDLSELFEYVTGERYRAKMFGFSLDELLTGRLPRFVAQLVAELSLFALLAPAGLFLLRDAWVARLLGLSLAGQLTFIVGYDIPDIEIYIIPVALISAVLAGVALEHCAEGNVWRRSATAFFAVLCLVMLPYFNFGRMTHEESERFAESIDEQLQELGSGAVVVGRVQYSQRMAYVYHLYAEHLSQAKGLHLSDSAKAADVVRYLSGTPVLKDSHTQARLPLGLKVFITRRAEREGWITGSGLELGPRRRGLREVR